jgi:AraC-like DNA-binding protein
VFARSPHHPLSLAACAFALAATARHFAMADVPLSDLTFGLPCARPADAHKWTRVLGPNVRFSESRCYLRFPASSLAAEMKTADPFLSAYLTGDDDRRRNSLAREVSRTVSTALGTKTQLLVAVAERLGTSPRTLQRRLNAEGLEFTALVDGARRQRALELVARPGIRISQAVSASGYTDARAFRVAFERWAGCTPREYRRRLRSGIH